MKYTFVRAAKVEDLTENHKILISNKIITNSQEKCPIIVKSNNKNYVWITPELPFKTFKSCKNIVRELPTLQDWNFHNRIIEKYQEVEKNPNFVGRIIEDKNFKLFNDKDLTVNGRYIKKINHKSCPHCPICGDTLAEVNLVRVSKNSYICEDCVNIQKRMYPD